MFSVLTARSCICATHKHLIDMERITDAILDDHDDVCAIFILGSLDAYLNERMHMCIVHERIAFGSVVQPVRRVFNQILFVRHKDR